MLWATRLLASLDGVVEASHGLCAVISGAIVLPDLMTFLLALPFLMIELPCLPDAMMHVTGSVEVSFNALTCLVAVLVTVVFLKFVISGW